MKFYDVTWVLFCVYQISPNHLGHNYFKVWSFWSCLLLSFKEYLRHWEIFPSRLCFVSGSWLISKFHRPCSLFSNYFSSSLELVSYSQIFSKILRNHEILWCNLGLVSYLSNFSKTLKPYFKVLKLFQILQALFIYS
jgi:hypothetical protein